MMKADKQVALAENMTQTQKRSVEEWISAIDELVGRQKRTVFEIGDLLVQAETELSKKRFRDAVKASGLRSKQTANNYMRVAKADHLRKPDVFPHLPTTVGALIDLAAWKDSAIAEGIRTRIIHPQAERNKLRKWNYWYYFRPPVEERPAATARVVAYIMRDIATDSWERSDELWDKFDEMKLAYLPDYMHITPYDDDILSQHRLEQLWKRVWTAYETDPTLFVDPRFQKVVERRRINGDGGWLYLKEIAPIIASGDHTPLHKIIRFSKSDWKFLGVTNAGYATLLAYFV